MAYRMLAKYGSQITHDKHRAAAAAAAIRFLKSFCMERNETIAVIRFGLLHSSYFISIWKQMSAISSWSILVDTYRRKIVPSPLTNKNYCFATEQVMVMCSAATSILAM